MGTHLQPPSINTREICCFSSVSLIFSLLWAVTVNQVWIFTCVPSSLAYRRTFVIKTLATSTISFIYFFSLLRLLLPLLLLLLPHPLLLPVLPFLFLLLLPLLFLDFFPSLFFLILNVLTPSVRGPVPKPILTKAPVGWINNIALFRYQLYYKKERIFFQ